MKSMTKFQLEHFERKVKRQYDPPIEEQELLVRRYKTEATDQAVDKLSKKMGADVVINKFREAEKELKAAQATALTFFSKKKPKESELHYKFERDNSSVYDITLADCEEQLREWASNLAEREIEKRPEGKLLRQLKDTRQQAIDSVMEAGCPEDLIKQLAQISQCIGLTWDVELKKLPNIKEDLN